MTESRFKNFFNYGNERSKEMRTRVAQADRRSRSRSGSPRSPGLAMAMTTTAFGRLR